MDITTRRLFLDYLDSCVDNKCKFEISIYTNVAYPDGVFSCDVTWNEEYEWQRESLADNYARWIMCHPNVKDDDLIDFEIPVTWYHYVYALRRRDLNTQMVELETAMERLNEQPSVHHPEFVEF